MDRKVTYRGREVTRRQVLRRMAQEASSVGLQEVHFRGDENAGGRPALVRLNGKPWHNVLVQDPDKLTALEELAPTLNAVGCHVTLTADDGQLVEVLVETPDLFLGFMLDAYHPGDDGERIDPADRHE